MSLLILFRSEETGTSALIGANVSSYIDYERLLMRKNVANQELDFQMNDRAGVPLTTSVSVYVKPEGGSYAAGIGTLAHQGNGLWNYIADQTETNYNKVSFQAVHASGVNQTVTVYPVAFDPTVANLATKVYDYDTGKSPNEAIELNYLDTLFKNAVTVWPATQYSMFDHLVEDNPGVGLRFKATALNSLFDPTNIDGQGTSLVLMMDLIRRTLSTQWASLSDDFLYADLTITVKSGDFTNCSIPSIYTFSEDFSSNAQQGSWDVVNGFQVGASPADGNFKYIELEFAVTADFAGGELELSWLTTNSKKYAINVPPMKNGEGFSGYLMADGSLYSRNNHWHYKFSDGLKQLTYLYDPAKTAASSAEISVLSNQISNIPSVGLRVATTLPSIITRPKSGDPALWVQVDLFLVDQDGNSFDSKDCDGGSYSATADYFVGWRVRPTADNAGNYFHELTTKIGTGGATAPASWSQTIGGTSEDGDTNTWTNVGGGDFDEAYDYSVNDIVKPSANNAGGYFYKLTTKTGTGGATVPGTWGQTLNGTTEDGDTNVWTNVGTEFPTKKYNGFGVVCYDQLGAEMLLYDAEDGNTLNEIINCHHASQTTHPQVATHVATGVYRFWIKIEDTTDLGALNLFYAWFDKARYEVGYSTANHKRQIAQTIISSGDAVTVGGYITGQDPATLTGLSPADMKQIRYRLAVDGDTDTPIVDFGSGTVSTFDSVANLPFTIASEQGHYLGGMSLAQITQWFYLMLSTKFVGKLRHNAVTPPIITTDGDLTDVTLTFKGRRSGYGGVNADPNQFVTWGTWTTVGGWVGAAWPSNEDYYDFWELDIDTSWRTSELLPQTVTFEYTPNCGEWISPVYIKFKLPHMAGGVQSENFFGPDHDGNLYLWRYDSFNSINQLTPSAHVKTLEHFDGSNTVITDPTQWLNYALNKSRDWVPGDALINSPLTNLASLIIRPLITKDLLIAAPTSGSISISPSRPLVNNEELIISAARGGITQTKDGGGLVVFELDVTGDEVIGTLDINGWVENPAYTALYGQGSYLLLDLNNLESDVTFTIVHTGMGDNKWTFDLPCKISNGSRFYGWLRSDGSILYRNYIGDSSIETAVQQPAFRLTSIGDSSWTSADVKQARYRLAIDGATEEPATTDTINVNVTKVTGNDGYGAASYDPFDYIDHAMYYGRNWNQNDVEKDSIIGHQAKLMLDAYFASQLLQLRADTGDLELSTSRTLTTGEYVEVQMAVNLGGNVTSGSYAFNEEDRRVYGTLDENGWTENVALNPFETPNKVFIALSVKLDSAATISLVRTPGDQTSEIPFSKSWTFPGQTGVNHAYLLRDGALLDWGRLSQPSSGIRDIMVAYTPANSGGDGGGGATPADIWTYGTRGLTENVNLVPAYDAAKTAASQSSLDLIANKIENIPSVGLRVASTLPSHISRDAIDTNYILVDCFLVDMEGKAFDSKFGDVAHIFDENIAYPEGWRIRPTTDNPGSYIYRYVLDNPPSIPEPAPATWDQYQNATIYTINGNRWICEGGGDFDPSMTYNLGFSVRPLTNNPAGYYYYWNGTGNGFPADAPNNWDQTIGSITHDKNQNEWVNIGYNIDNVNSHNNGFGVLAFDQSGNHVELYDQWTSPLRIANFCVHNSSPIKPQLPLRLATGVYRFAIKVTPTTPLGALNLFYAWFDKPAYANDFAVADHRRQLAQTHIETSTSGAVDANVVGWNGAAANDTIANMVLNRGVDALSGWSWADVLYYGAPVNLDMMSYNLNEYMPEVPPGGYTPVLTVNSGTLPTQLDMYIETNFWDNTYVLVGSFDSSGVFSRPGPDPVYGDGALVFAVTNNDLTTDLDLTLVAHDTYRKADVTYELKIPQYVGANYIRFSTSGKAYFQNGYAINPSANVSTEVTVDTNSIVTAIEGSAVIAKESSVLARPTVAQLEASTFGQKIINMFKMLWNKKELEQIADSVYTERLYDDDSITPIKTTTIAKVGNTETRA